MGPETPMNMRAITILVSLIAIASVLGGAWYWYSTRGGGSAASTFERAIREANVSETVAVAGRSYIVGNGDVTATDGTVVSPEERRAAFTLAYALAMARRNPILGIPGTDPAALEARAGELKDVIESVAEAQTVQSDATTIRALYPTDFLISLAELERRRQAFLASGSEADAARYAGQLTVTLTKYLADAERFTTAFQQMAADTPMRLPTFGGTITTERLVQGAVAVSANARRLTEENARRTRCLENAVGSCIADTLADPVLAVNADAALAIPELTRDIIEFRSGFLDLIPFGAPGESPIISIFALSSTCAAGEPAPHYFILRSTPQDFASGYVGDLFFSDTSAATGDTLRYMRDAGIGYSSLQPLNYYMCPDIMYDVGRIRAMADVRDFALAHPLLAQSAREALSREVLSETAAERYLAEALQATTDPRERNALTELSLAFTRRTAGLQFVLRDIARVASVDLQHAQSGVPFDISARTVTLTHTAFPSLFLVHAGPERVTVYEPSTPGEKEQFAGYALRYSNLIRTVSRDELLDDMRQFLLFEGFRAR